MEITLTLLGLIDNVLIFDLGDIGFGYGWTGSIENKMGALGW